ncbi:HepT-like ribonuclease domain-containing protein [Methanoregula boonei]|uniref:HepT-like ribonuclease domain-containing protein n=1 Tax=Methanoregula boonei TaxID=358766 RepID=UPI002FBE3498
MIGEAIKNLPAGLKEKYPKTDWKKIAGFRDVLTHAYFGIKPTILWDNATNKLPLLKKEIRQIFKNEESRK